MLINHGIIDTQDMESVQIWSFFVGSLFPVFGLNTKLVTVFSPNTEIYRQEKVPNSDSLHVVTVRD